MYLLNLSVFLISFVAFTKSQVEISPFMSAGTEVQFAELPFLVPQLPKM